MPPLADSDFLPPRIFTGSCHCQSTRYALRLRLPNFTVDPSNPPPEFIRRTHPEATGAPFKHLRIYKCNCTVCHKAGIFHLRLAHPADDFVVLHPSSLEELGLYKCNDGESAWYFCKNCGVRCFTVAGPSGLEKARIDLEAWKKGGKAEESKEGGAEGELTEVLRPARGFTEENRQDYLSVNAVSLDAEQEGLDLREWTEKHWIAYGDFLHDSGPLSYTLTGPHPGGLY